MNTHIIAEIGVNHNGDLSLAKDMINAAMACGASSVKFQLFNSTELTSQFGGTSPYQKLAGYNNMRQMLSGLELSKTEMKQIYQYCNDVAVQLIVTPYSESDIDFLVDECGAQIIKVASMFCDDLPFLEHLASKNVNVILSTGMTSQGEVDKAVELFAFLDQRLTLLHCTTSYPTNDIDMHLKVIPLWKKKYHCQVGLSDHGVGITPSICAVALGASTLEKHFTLDKALPGPDQTTSLDPKEFSSLCFEVGRVEQLLGSPKKEKLDVELGNEAVMKRGVFFAVKKEKGDQIDIGDIKFQRPRNNLAPFDLKLLIGKTLIEDVEVGQPIDPKKFL